MEADPYGTPRVDLSEVRGLEQPRPFAVPFLRSDGDVHVYDHVARDVSMSEECDEEDCQQCAIDALATTILWAAGRLDTIATLADQGAAVGDILRTQAEALRNVLIFEEDLPEPEPAASPTLKPSHLKLVE